MKLYSITDGYIDYLIKSYPHVYSNKENRRTHERKYIGAVLDVNGYLYFVPLSSPKDKDYLIIDDKKIIKKDSFTIFRICSKVESGIELRGTIQFANMIPVPEKELILYDVDSEADEDYKNLVLEELEYIRKNERKIENRAKAVYIERTKENSKLSCLDFKGLESMHDIWLENVKQ